jgi:hypothetical protein
VVEANEAPLAVDEHADRVKAQVGRAGAVGDLEQECRGHPPDLFALALVQGLPRSAAGAVGSPRLDLDEDQGAAIEDDEVDLAVARAVVARDERVAKALEVGEREVFAEASEVLSQVGGHGRRRYGASRYT